MIFHEIYGNYYNVIAEILKEAIKGKLDDRKIDKIIRKKAFQESSANIPEKLNNNWKLLKDNKTIIRNTPRMPLTTMQKQWLKAICLDPRAKLFAIDETGLEDVTPLFKNDDIVYFDRNVNADPYEDPGYIEIFHSVLEAVNDYQNVKITYMSQRGFKNELVCIPQFIEYSPKDDRFRVQVELLDSSDSPILMMMNMARIVSCEITDDETYNDDRESRTPQWIPVGEQRASILLKVIDERNTLERALLTFSHLERETKRIDDKIYHIRLTYDVTDETELLINILSFGPTIEVLEPSDFISKIKERLTKQNSLS